MERLLYAQDEATIRFGDPGDLFGGERPGRWCWLDISSIDPERITEIGERLGIARPAIEDILDVALQPKFDRHGFQLFAVLHGLVVRGDRVDTAEIDCIATDELFITVHEGDIAAVDWLWDNLQRYPQLGQDGPEMLFAQLAEVVGRRFIPVVEALDERITEISVRAISGDPSVPGDVAALQRDVAEIRKVLRPQRAVLLELEQGATAGFSRDVRIRIADAHDLHDQVFEELASARLQLGDVLDTYRAAVAERTGEITKVLTVYAAIVLPLSLISSFYGMNISHLPAAREPWGLALVVAIMLGVAAVSWLWFLRRGFVRAPGVAAVPRKLGSGLVSAVAVPVRSVSALVTRPTRGSPRNRSGDHEA